MPSHTETLREFEAAHKNFLALRQANLPRSEEVVQKVKAAYKEKRGQLLDLISGPR